MHVSSWGGPQGGGFSREVVDPGPEGRRCLAQTLEGFWPRGKGSQPRGEDFGPGEGSHFVTCELLLTTEWNLLASYESGRCHVLLQHTMHLREVSHGIQRGFSPEGGYYVVTSSRDLGVWPQPVFHVFAD